MAPSYELLCSGLLVVLSNSAVGRGLVPAANPPGTVAAPRGLLGERAHTKLRACVAAVSKELRRLIDHKDNGWPAAVRARDWARGAAREIALLNVAETLRDGEYPDPQSELSAELEALGTKAAPPGSTTHSDDYATLAEEWEAFSMSVRRHTLDFMWKLMLATLRTAPSGWVAAGPTIGFTFGRVGENALLPPSRAQEGRSVLRV